MPECGAVWSGRALGRDSDAPVGLKASKWIDSTRRTADERFPRAPNEGIDVRGSRGAFRSLCGARAEAETAKDELKDEFGMPSAPVDDRG